MEYKVYPTQYECYDSTDSLVFKIETFDEYCSNVSIPILVTPDSWLEISDLIHKCLSEMHKEKKEFD